MRLQVDMLYGYASFDMSDEDKAWELYHQDGVRLRLIDYRTQLDIVLAGAPLGANIIRERGAA